MTKNEVNEIAIANDSSRMIQKIEFHRSWIIEDLSNENSLKTLDAKISHLRHEFRNKNYNQVISECKSIISEYFK